MYNYFAYGINVNSVFMHDRVKDNFETIDGISILKDHEIIFGGGSPAIKRWKGNVLAVREKKDSIVIGVCYKVNDKALSILDEIEHATASHNPMMYVRTKAKTYTINPINPFEIDYTTPHECFVYVASKYFLDTLDNKNVSEEYIKLIKKGMRYNMSYILKKLIR